MFKKLFIALGFLSLFMGQAAYAQDDLSYLKAMITQDEAIEAGKSTIFDSSQSFIPDSGLEYTYIWDFGDGNSNEGGEVLHSYNEPGKYSVSLTISDGENESIANFEIFAYRKLIVLITDITEAEDRIEVIQNFAEKEGVYINLIDSFGSSTEFISEEILTKKLIEESESLMDSSQILVWTKENAGLNAISRFLQSNENKLDLSSKTLTVLDNEFESNIGRIQNQYTILNPKDIILAKEAALNPLIESSNDLQFLEILEKGGYEFKKVNKKTGTLRPWNFMSYFVSTLTNQGIPDNTIILLLLLPVIATIITFMKQVVGVTTFGIYTPSIMTLSFLIIGIYAGLVTLLISILTAVIARALLKKTRMLYLPKVSIVIILVSVSILGMLILNIYLDLFDVLSISIFPMLILSTLVEKIIKVKSDAKIFPALASMSQTTLVALIAYFAVGGVIDLGFTAFHVGIIKRLMLAYPELIILLLIINVLMGKWSGLRIMERIRFREILKNLE